MAAKTYLAGDLGGTKTFLALYRDAHGQLEQAHSHRYISAEWRDLESMLVHFLEQAPEELSKPDTSCIAVAGPVRHGSAQLTNLSWTMSEASLQAATGLQKLELVNDFAVLIHGLPHFNDQQQVVLQIGRGRTTPAPAGDDNGAVAILGAGTGLGMARGLPAPDGWLALPSEGGHREFAPRTDDEWALAQWLRKDLNLERLSIERIVSGTGLGHVMHWLLQHDQARVIPWPSTPTPGATSPPIKPVTKICRRTPARRRRRAIPSPRPRSASGWVPMDQRPGIWRCRSSASVDFGLGVEPLKRTWMDCNPNSFWNP